MVVLALFSVTFVDSGVIMNRGWSLGCHQVHMLLVAVQFSKNLIESFGFVRGADMD